MFLSECEANFLHPTLMKITPKSLHSFSSSDTVCVCVSSFSAGLFFSFGYFISQCLEYEPVCRNAPEAGQNAYSLHKHGPPHTHRRHYLLTGSAYLGRLLQTTGARDSDTHQQKSSDTDCTDVWVGFQNPCVTPVSPYLVYFSVHSCISCLKLYNNSYVSVFHM